MASPIVVPDGLPPVSTQTSAEHPWPLWLLAKNVDWMVRSMPQLWIEGEIVQYEHKNGRKTQYLTIHDLSENVSMRMSAFTHLIPDGIGPGTHVIANVKPSFWTVNGSFSLFASDIRPAGIGALLAQLERLRAILRSEGLFDASRKKKLPFIPQNIGLIVGPNTRAETDITVQARERWESVAFTILHAHVQGAQAVAEIIDALQQLDDDPAVDVIIMARGGGSMEDLLPFSDETLVRAVARASTPIVVAIGHQDDHPIVEEVADLVAATPTDAAKTIVPDIHELAEAIDMLVGRVRAAITRTLNHAQTDIDTISSRVGLAHPEGWIDAREQDISVIQARIRTRISSAMTLAENQLAADTARVRALSPLATIERGYAVLTDHGGHVVSSVHAVANEDTVSARVSDGSLLMSVTGIRDDEAQQEHDARYDDTAHRHGIPDREDTAHSDESSHDASHISNTSNTPETDNAINDATAQRKDNAQ
ncbi:MAG: exodeoxyribonuclease VII large subunit [Actinomycetaceae bacterium]|nr:exodeoxyribonuclease VII large subunit [Actinomycetaceae bacterium]MDY6083564.1 exodeoxyribonuclease VII large subunit [Actinomycetaceae bacterium]